MSRWHRNAAGLMQSPQFPSEWVPPADWSFRIYPDPVPANYRMWTDRPNSVKYHEFIVGSNCTPAADEVTFPGYSGSFSSSDVAHCVQGSLVYDVGDSDRTYIFQVNKNATAVHDMMFGRAYGEGSPAERVFLFSLAYINSASRPYFYTSLGSGATNCYSTDPAHLILSGVDTRISFAFRRGANQVDIKASWDGGGWEATVDFSNSGDLSLTNLAARPTVGGWDPEGSKSSAFPPFDGSIKGVYLYNRALAFSEM